VIKYGKSPTGNPLTIYVNMHQTAEERRDKYHYHKSLGYSWQIANQRRDWRWTTIQYFIDKELGGNNAKEKPTINNQDL